MDKITTPEDDGPWNFDLQADRTRARKWIEDHRPLLVIGSPVCGMFSKLMALNRKRMGEAKYQDLYRKALGHLDFALSIDKLQICSGRLFLHEHPADATSWLACACLHGLRTPVHRTTLAVFFGARK